MEQGSLLRDVQCGSDKVSMRFYVHTTYVLGIVKWDMKVLLKDFQCASESMLRRNGLKHCLT